MPSRVNLRTAHRGTEPETFCLWSRSARATRTTIYTAMELGDHTSNSPSTIVIVSLNDTDTAYGSMWTQILVTKPPNFFKTYDYLI